MTEKADAPSLVLAANFSSTAVSILDGDTIEVLHHHQHPERIHLSGIDCSDKRQVYGQRSK